MRSWLMFLPFVALWACGKPIQGTRTTLDVTTIGRAGGTVVGQGGVAGAQLVIPFGALAQDTPIALGEDPEPPPPPAGLIAAGPALLCSPEGLIFDRPATLIIPYRGLSDVMLYTAPAIHGVGYEPYDGGLPNTGTNTISAPVGHLSRWRVFRVFVDGGASDGG
jgi:hypothetical protein